MLISLYAEREREPGCQREREREEKEKEKEKDKEKEEQEREKSIYNSEKGNRKRGKGFREMKGLRLRG